MIIPHSNYNDEVVIIDCVVVDGYSRMCNHAWKDDLGRWFLPKSVFKTYHQLTGYNKKVREFLLRRGLKTRNP